MIQRKVAATLSPFIAQALNDWADVEGTKPATLANFLIESAVREAIKDGIIPSPAAATAGDDDEDEELAARKFLKLLAAREKPTNGKLLKLAHDLDIREEILIEIRDRFLANCNREGAKC